MTRSLKKWIGKTDDEAVPARVKIRIFDAHKGRCAICTLSIGGSLRPAYDHIVAIINGGINGEDNVRLLCLPCHSVKTRADLAEKSMVARKKAKHIGIKKPSRFPGSRDSIWKKKMDGSVVRR